MITAKKNFLILLLCFLFCKLMICSNCSRYSSDPKYFVQSINEYGSVEQFDVDFTSSEFIKEKIGECKLFDKKINVEKRSGGLDPQTYTIFKLYQNDVVTHIVKTQPFKDLQYQSNTEVLCYEIAKKTGLDGIIPHTVKISDGIIASSYIYQDEEKCFEYSSENLRDYNNYVFSQDEIEKALVFSFLTMQKDMANKNILFIWKSFKMYLIDFCHSMSEREMSQYECNFNAILPDFLSKKHFKSNLNKVPSEEIKKLVNNLSEINFYDLFKKYELKVEDQESFYRRLEDLQDSFNSFPHQSLGLIFMHLFKSRPIYTQRKKFKKMLNIPAENKIYKTLAEINNRFKKKQSVESNKLPPPTDPFEKKDDNTTKETNNAINQTNVSYNTWSWKNIFIGGTVFSILASFLIYYLKNQRQKVK